MSSSQYITQFKKQPLEKRLEMSSNVLKKYPDRCTIIVSKKDGTDLCDIEKHKFICPRDINLAQFTYSIRKKLTLKQEKSIFVFINDKIFPSSMLMGQLYQENKENDGFMYVVYCAENTFGAEGVEGVKTQ
jgi:GABA(A) receptor-associated protein